MSKGFFHVPVPKNEPVKSYNPGSPERKELKAMIAEMRSKVIELPMYIGGKEVKSNNKIEIHPPHDLNHLLGYFYQGDETHVVQAIDAALEARTAWADLGWQHRAAIFLKAADLLAGPYRARINAATMLGQSKNAYQAEIDAACELADFYRYGVRCMTQIYEMQPESNPGMWNYNEFRPLEGFVFALTPFNFTSIAGNLPVAPVMMGNVCVWKPSKTAIYSAAVIMEILKEAGLPDGVINLVYVSGPAAGKIIFSHPDFAGIHFTGSTGVFQDIWKTIGENIFRFKSYPRIVGETGGKDFIFADPTSDTKALATAILRVCEDDDYGNSLSREAVQAAQPFDRRVVDAQEVAIYHEAMNLGPPPPSRKASIAAWQVERSLLDPFRRVTPGRVAKALGRRLRHACGGVSS